MQMRIVAPRINEIDLRDGRDRVRPRRPLAKARGATSAVYFSIDANDDGAKRRLSRVVGRSPLHLNPSSCIREWSAATRRLRVAESTSRCPRQRRQHDPERR